MRPLNYLLVAAAAGTLGAGTSWYYYSSRISLDASAQRRLIGSKEETIRQLESAQEEFKASLARSQGLQGSLEGALSAERARVADLQREMRDVIAQNRALIRKVELARQVEGKDQELQGKLAENIQRNQELAAQLFSLEAKLKASTTKPSEGGKELARVLGQGRADSRVTDLETWVAWLKTKDELNQLELAKRRDRIHSLEEEIRKREDKLAFSLEQFKEMERDNALAKERNVALQIDRENLISDLNAARAELSQMQEKLSQIGKLLLLSQQAQTAFSPADQPGEPAVAGKRVDVEVQGGRAGTR